MSKLQNKLDNFKKAIARLKEAVEEYRENGSSDVIRDGMIQRFEFTYELAWKTTKAYLEDMGIFDKNSPKAVIKEAFAQKIIENEKVWISILEDRNSTTHLYSEEIIEEIAGRVADEYVIEFKSLLESLENTK